MISVVEDPATKQRFVLLDAPTQRTLPNYLELLEQENVKQLVRICNRPSHSYDAEEVEHLSGIRVIDDIKFEDGGVPNSETIRRWLDLVNEARQHGLTLGVHCVAGIGRAPVLVALSLVESGMDPLDAVSYIRKHRRGALNKSQIRFIDSYKPTHRQKTKWFSRFRF